MTCLKFHKFFKYSFSYTQIQTFFQERIIQTHLAVPFFLCIRYFPFLEPQTKKYAEFERTNTSDSPKIMYKNMIVSFHGVKYNCYKLKAYIHAQTNSNPLANKYSINLLYGYVESKTYQYINPNVRNALAKLPFMKWHKAKVKLDSIVKFLKSYISVQFSNTCKTLFHVK